MRDSLSLWEIEIGEVFDIPDRAGVAVVGTWLIDGKIQSGSPVLVIHDGNAERVDGVRIEFHQPKTGIALFLPGLTKHDLAPGDRIRPAQ